MGGTQCVSIWWLQMINVQSQFLLKLLREVILKTIQEIVPDVIDDDTFVVALLTNVPFIKETLGRLIEQTPNQIRDRDINLFGNSVRDYLFDAIDESILDETPKNVHRRVALAKINGSEYFR